MGASLSLEQKAAMVGSWEERTLNGSRYDLHAWPLHPECRKEGLDEIRLKSALREMGQCIQRRAERGEVGEWK